MNIYKSAQIFILILIISLLFTGCVERTLTIKSNPSQALVTLNDEEIGETPVTVSFNWYGDYNIRLTKQGYQTLSTHRKLKGPWYDKFPFDFFAQILNPNKIVNSYQWDFKLDEYKQANREDLIRRAQEMRLDIKK